MTQSHSNERYAKIGILMDLARHRSDDLFDALGIKLRRYGHRYVGQCPVHGGDSFDSLNYYPDGEKHKVFWECLSEHCEATFGGHLIGFVQGILSHQKRRWEDPKHTNRIVPKNEVINFICKFVGMSWDQIEYDPSIAEHDQFTSGMEIFTACGGNKAGGYHYSRESVRAMLKIPAQYYLKRGFSSEILDSYDVGLCIDKNHELYGRVVVPIHTQDGKRIVGCIGRSRHDKCPSCEMYHHPVYQECFEPGRHKPALYAKWRCQEGFQDKNYLYNYHGAAPHVIPNNRTLVIVEGCADVWKLIMNGIYNVVALNGAALTTPQEVDIECLGVTTLVCLFDNDSGGERAFDNISKRCWIANNKIHGHIPEEFNDIGEMPTGHPFFDNIKSLYSNASKEI